MGNICCKRQITEPKRNKKDKTDNLELYLNGVYRKECVFKVDQEEVEFIQTGIEILVQEIADLVLANYSMTISAKQYRKFKKDLVEFYSQLKIEHKQGRSVVKENTATSSIIKVGSFYEETKNNFPDEFDFIFLLLCGRDKSLLDILTLNALFDIAAEHILTVTTDHKESLSHVCPNRTLNVTRSLHFDQYVMNHGPATMLRFIYNNGIGEEKNISVDLVPAMKVNVIGNRTDLYKKIFREDFNLNFKSFYTEVMSAKNFLLVRYSPSVTETEVHFMRNILSKKHVKVYRILKFLINGHGDGDILELYFRINLPLNGKGCSSYQIKRMMFHHHDECRSPDEARIGDCIIQILEEMCNYSYIDQLPGVSQRSDKKTFPLLLYLKNLLERLKSIQTSEDSYDYERIKTKSVSKHYLDTLESDDPENARWFKYLDTLDGADPSYESYVKFRHFTWSGSNF